MFLVNGLVHRSQLFRHDFDRRARFTLLQALAAAQNDTDATLYRGQCFLRDELIFFSQDGAAFGVAKEGPGDVGVFELVDRDLAGEGAVGAVENVLGGDFDGGVQVFAGEEEVEGWWGDDDFGVGI